MLLLNWFLSLISNINFIGCKTWKNMREHPIFFLHPKDSAYCSLKVSNINRINRLHVPTPFSYKNTCTHIVLPELLSWYWLLNLIRDSFLSHKNGHDPSREAALSESENVFRPDKTLLLSVAEPSFWKHLLLLYCLVFIIIFV